MVLSGLTQSLRTADRIGILVDIMPQFQYLNPDGGVRNGRGNDLISLSVFDVVTRGQQIEITLKKQFYGLIFRNINRFGMYSAAAKQKQNP